MTKTQDIKSRKIEHCPQLNTCRGSDYFIYTSLYVKLITVKKKTDIPILSVDLLLSKIYSIIKNAITADSHYAIKIDCVFGKH